MVTACDDMFPPAPKLTDSPSVLDAKADALFSAAEAWRSEDSWIGHKTATLLEQSGYDALAMAWDSEAPVVL
jgi:hypothetical protein